ncbi:hypothetical protein SNEBB_009651, partial [Seison nebaliae]
MKFILLLVVISLLCHEIIGASSFRFANYYSDGGIIQRGKRNTIWGYCDKEVHSIQFESNEKKYEAIISQSEVDCKWKIIIEECELGKTYSLNGTEKITSNSNDDIHIQIGGLLCGDIWICSGQSNMQLMLSQVFRYKEEQALAVEYPQVRLLAVLRKDMATEQNEPIITMNWTRPTVDNVASFSAVCWMFGRRLFDKERVPIGLINSCYGGSAIQCWVDDDVLDKCDISQNEFPKGIIRNERNNIEIYEPKVLWNGMIHPFLNLSITGVLWYQGEQNAAMFHNKYSCLTRE